MTRKIGIVIYGECRSRNDFWALWLDKAKELVDMIGYTPTHAAITGTSLPVGLRTFQRSEKKIRIVIANREPVESLSVYSLPKNFNTCADNHCWLVIQDNKYSKFAYCEMNFEECSDELVKSIKNAFIDFIEMEQCEIFTMDKSQVPFNYAFKGKGNDISHYSTLEILYQTKK